MDEIRLTMDENGVFHEYEEPYMTIECQTEEDFEYIKAAVEFYKRNRWFPISEPPKEEGWYHIAIRDKKTGRIRVVNDLYAVEIAERHGHSLRDCQYFRQKTNSHRLRQMNDAELANFLCNYCNCTTRGCPGCDLCVPGTGRANGILKWLQQPVEDKP